MTTVKLRKKVIAAATYICIMLFALGLIIFPAETSAAAVEGLSICANVLIPSLFPFLVVSSVAVQSGLASYAGRLFKKPMRVLFGVPGACAPAFILGLVGGYPVGAKTAISLYEQGLCTRAEAERLLSFCNNSGPAFILGAVGSAVFGTTAAGVLLYGSHMLASVCVGVMFRRYKEGGRPQNSGKGDMPFSAAPLRKAFTSAVTSSFSSILNICAFVIFFSVAIRLLILSGVLPTIAGLLGTLLTPLGLDSAFAEKLISGLLEVTSGVYGLISTTASINAKLSAAAFMLGWAGISVHCQVLNFIGDSGLSTLPYIGGKMLHGVFSALFAYAGAWMLPFDAQTSKMLGEHIDSIISMTPAQSFCLSLLAVAAVWLVFLVLSALFACKKGKKRI